MEPSRRHDVASERKSRAALIAIQPLPGDVTMPFVLQGKRIRRVREVILPCEGSGLLRDVAAKADDDKCRLLWIGRRGDRQYVDARHALNLVELDVRDRSEHGRERLQPGTLLRGRQHPGTGAMGADLQFIEERLRRSDHIDRVRVILVKKSVHLRRADLVRRSNGGHAQQSDADPSYRSNVSEAHRLSQSALEPAGAATICTDLMSQTPLFGSASVTRPFASVRALMCAAGSSRWMAVTNAFASGFSSKRTRTRSDVDAVGLVSGMSS